MTRKKTNPPLLRGAPESSETEDLWACLTRIVAKVLKKGKQVISRKLSEIDEQFRSRCIRCIEIQKGNDAFRKAMFDSPNWNQYTMSIGVAMSPNWESILDAVHAFVDFLPKDDPNNEHDFGNIMIENVDYLFTINYYDRLLKTSVNPYKVEPTRVLTVMRADEYWTTTRRLLKALSPF